MYTKQGKLALNRAFRQLRRVGIFAQQDFWCCAKCAWCVVPEEAETAVFYHRQAYADLRETGSCYLQWQGSADGIIQILQEHGIQTDWGGSVRDAIRITLPQIAETE